MTKLQVLSADKINRPIIARQSPTNRPPIARPSPAHHSIVARSRPELVTWRGMAVCTVVIQEVSYSSKAGSSSANVGGSAAELGADDNQPLLTV
jgi:hypothetical protein